MRIKFEGKTYTFPDGTSDEEVAAILGEQASIPNQAPPEATPVNAEAAPTGFPGSSTLDKLKSGASAVGEMITGNERSTPETQMLPDYSEMPELQVLFGGDDPAKAFTTRAAINFAGSDEIAKIIQARFPGVTVRQDAKGNNIFKSALDGQEYPITPGLTVSDIGRFAAGAPLMAIPFGSSVARAMAIGGATQAGIEGSQAAAGGSFDTGDIAASALTAGALKGVANTGSGIKQLLTKTPDQALTAVAGQAGESLVKDSSGNWISAGMADATEDGLSTINIGGAATPSPQQPPLNSLELAADARTAAGGGLGSKAATKNLAAAAAPDSLLAADLKTLGLEDQVSPEFVAANQAFKDLSAAAAQSPGSLTKGNRANSILEVANAGEKLLREIGSTGDRGTLRHGVKNSVDSNITRLEQDADRLSIQLESEAGPATEIRATTALQFLEKQLRDAKGNRNVLSSLEREIYDELTPAIVPRRQVTAMDGSVTESVEDISTLSLINSYMKKLGAAGKKNSPYQDISTGRANRLYGLLSEDVKTGLASNPAALATLLQRNASVTIRKGLEAEAQSLFGKRLTGNLMAQVKRVTQGLAEGGDDAYVRTMQAVPERYRQRVAAESLRMMFGKLKADGSLDIGSFSQFWDGLKANPRSYAAMASNLPKGSIQKFESLNRLSKAVTAKPGEAVDAVKQRILNAETLMEKLSDFSSRFFSRAGAEIGTSAVGLHGVGAMWAMTRALSKSNNHLLKATDELLASPELAHTIKNLSNEGSKVALKKLTMSKAFKAFKKAFGNPKELDKFDEAMLQAIQAASRPNREEVL